MTLLAPVLGISLLLAIIMDSQGGETPMDELEEALRRSAEGSDSFGADLPESSAREARAYRPAQLLLRMEVSEIPDHLLLATLIAGATGKRDPVDVANDLLREVGGDLGRLTRPDLYTATPGLGDTARARVLAASELSRRAVARSTSMLDVIKSPDDAFNIVRRLPVDSGVEYLMAIYVDSQNAVVTTRLLSKGSKGCTLVDPIEVFRPAIALRANGVIMIHNHPSGRVDPSSEDVTVTRRISEAGATLGVPLLDHLVISGSTYRSLAEMGFVPHHPQSRFTTK